MSWRRSSSASSSSGPSVTLATRFHDALRAADLALVRELVFREPRLANARDPTRGRHKATPVMSAILSCCSSSSSSSSSSRNDASSASRAVTLVSLLVAKGATLQAKDERKRQALMVACANGSHPSVIRRLLDWNRAESNGSARTAMSWSDEDSDGQTALMLACANGHGHLAAFIMDKLLTVRDWDHVCHPLQLLAVAIASGDERSAVELLRARSVQRAVVQDRGGVENTAMHGEWRQVDAQEDGASVAICVGKAVERGMSRLVQDMHALNRERVGRATWLAVHRLQTRETPRRKSSRRRVEAEPVPAVVVPRGIAAVVRLHKRDTVWESVRLLFLIRFKQVQAPKVVRDSYRRSALAVGFTRHVVTLPDDVFRLVVDFVKQPFDDAAEAQKERFRVLVEQDSW